MGKVLFAIVASVASLVLVESLTCNKCNFSLLGICLSGGTETCMTNTSFCYTSIPSFPSFSGFNSQGCTNDSSTCSTNSNSTVMGVTFQNNTICCSTDRCNTMTLNGAPSAKMTLSATIDAAILASVWGSMLQ